MSVVDLPQTSPLESAAVADHVPSIPTPASHPTLILVALATGGFAIGTTEFAAMSLLPAFAPDLGIDAPRLAM